MATSGKQLMRSKSGLRMVSVEEKDTSPFQLQEPPWIPDDQVSAVQWPVPGTVAAQVQSLCV